MKERVYTSRKLWGALLGSVCLMIMVKITPEMHIPSVIMAVGSLWAAAIGGQAVHDAINKKSNGDI
jgi:hypothetical protein